MKAKQARAIVGAQFMADRDRILGRLAARGLCGRAWRRPAASAAYGDRGGGEVGKISIGRGDGAGSVSLWRLHILQGADAEKAKTSAVVGIAEGVRRSEAPDGRIGGGGSGRPAEILGSARLFRIRRTAGQAAAVGREKPKAGSPVAFAGVTDAAPEP